MTVASLLFSSLCTSFHSLHNKRDLKHVKFTYGTVSVWLTGGQHHLAVSSYWHGAGLLLPSVRTTRLDIGLGLVILGFSLLFCSKPTFGSHTQTFYIHSPECGFGDAICHNIDIILIHFLCWFNNPTCWHHQEINSTTTALEYAMDFDLIGSSWLKALCFIESNTSLPQHKKGGFLGLHSSGRVLFYHITINYNIVLQPGSVIWQCS